MATRTKIEGLPIQKEWMVVDVREGAEEPGQHGGTLKKFYVDFEGAPDVYWRRKLPATVEVGKSYFGTISEGKHGPVFKKESPGKAGGGGGGASGASSSRPWKPESQYDPEKTARIARSHAQGMALRYLEVNGETVDGMDELLPIIDWFEADVARAAGQAKASAPAPSAAERQAAPAPKPDDETEEREKFRALLETKALAPEAAGKLADFIMRLAPKDRVRAWNGLGQLDSEMQTLSELETGFRETEGEPLPTKTAPPEDDIPF